MMGNVCACILNSVWEFSSLSCNIGAGDKPNSSVESSTQRQKYKKGSPFVVNVALEVHFLTLENIPS